MKIRLLFLLILIVALEPAVAQTPPPGTRETRALLQGALSDFDKKKYDEALAKLAELDKKLPDDPFVENLIGAAYTRKKDYGKAKEYFEKALAKQPDFFPAKFNIGELLFLERRYAEALTFFEGMLSADPRNELLQFKVFLCLLEMDKMDEAKKVMDQIKYPGDTPAWYYAQAAWENKKGNGKKARDYLAGARYIFGKKTALFDETFEDLGINPR